MLKLSDIKGVGPKRLETLNENNISSVKDLIFKFPLRYLVYEESYDDFIAGNDTLISGIVESNPAFIKIKKVNAIIFYVYAYQNRYKCVLFSGDYLRGKIRANTSIRLYGKFNNQKREFLVKKIFFDEFNTKVECDYKIKNIPNLWMKRILEHIFSGNVKISEYLPQDLVDKYKLYPIYEYLYASHFPKNKKDVVEVQRRRKYEEFFWYSLRLHSLKSIRTLDLKQKREIDVAFVNKFIKNIEFSFTEDQLNVLSEIKRDITSDKVMNRLLQGDVGSGKSIVAYTFMMMEVSAGYQVAYMAPTEILANQVYNDLIKLTQGIDINIELLTSSIKNKDKEDIYYRLEGNRINVIVGTHALIEDKVLFSKLGGIIIDEQHKFGVVARQKLASKYKGVDALYMSATPIPRSLGLSFFGDLDISSIHHLPKGRIPITTRIVDDSNFNKMMSFIDKEIENHHQAYVVCPSIEESDDNPSINVTSCKYLFENGLKGRKIAVVHGKIDAKSRKEIMADFEKGKIDVLISTTIIEVGVNVKNATIMTIMDAHRFGLAQLHQLRGRVGRGNLKSYCFLVSNDVYNERLMAIEKENDGFNISEIDFKLRGPGDYFGTEQSGFNNFVYSSFEEDYKIFLCANKDALEYFNKYNNYEYKSKIFDEIIIYNIDKIGKAN